jgi:hypothetical protein
VEEDDEAESEPWLGAVSVVAEDVCVVEAGACVTAGGARAAVGGARPLASDGVCGSVTASEDCERTSITIGGGATPLAATATAEFEAALVQLTVAAVEAFTERGELEVAEVGAGKVDAVEAGSEEISEAGSGAGVKEAGA